MVENLDLKRMIENQQQQPEHTRQREQSQHHWCRVLVILHPKATHNRSEKIHRVDVIFQHVTDEFDAPP